MTLILGVDPGLTRCGLGLIQVGRNRKCHLVDVEVVRTQPDQVSEARIGAIGSRIREIVEKHRPAAIALERVFAQANLRTVMGTAQISGVVYFLADEFNIPVFTYTPTQVKAAVTGSGRAEKKQVGNMVARVLGLDEAPKPADAADALAIAISHAWSGGSATVSNIQTPAQRAWAAAESAAKRSK